MVVGVAGDALRRCCTMGSVGGTVGSVAVVIVDREAAGMD
jgi:hypothetical protein